MASIYFYYNELLRHSADQAVMNVKNHTHGTKKDALRQQRGAKKTFEKKHRWFSNKPGQIKSDTMDSQDEDKVLKALFLIYPDTEAILVTLQPCINRLAYLQTAVATNLDNVDALIRSLGPKL